MPTLSVAPVSFPLSVPPDHWGFRSCVGILRLVKRYGAERVDAVIVVGESGGMLPSDAGIAS